MSEICGHRKPYSENPSVETNPVLAIADGRNDESASNATAPAAGDGEAPRASAPAKTVSAVSLRDIGGNVAFVDAALAFHAAGFAVIPVDPGTKRPSRKWDPWLEQQSPATIAAHWAKHPDHELGFIVDDRTLVLDADSAESSTAVLQQEHAFGVTSNFVVKTRRAEHRYYRLAEGAFARTNAFGTADHPERIDVKATRSMVVLPPSTHKSIARCEVDRIDQLTVVGQDFVDAVFKHNGREPPRKHVDVDPPASPSPTGEITEMVQHLDLILRRINSDLAYDKWVGVLMAVHHETGGSEAGFAVVNAWSARGQTYCGERALREKWGTFEGYSGRPITIGTLRAMLREQGLDALDVLESAEPQFERQIDEAKPGPSAATAVQVTTAPSAPQPEITPELILAGFSITGSLKKLRRQLLEQKYLFEGIALMGEATILYAAPNTGKTLLVFWMLIQAIKHGGLDASWVFYINCDDSMAGLLKKGEIAAEHGFHMLADGYQGFEINKLRQILGEVMERGQALGSVVVLDTVKKATDLMDKRKGSDFMKLVRRFVLQGGTVVMLAHANKHPGADGKPIYAGTSDILDDADCGHTMWVSSPTGAPEKIVEFERKKARGNVVQRATFAYSGVDGLTYERLLASVRRVDAKEALNLQQAAEMQADAKLIELAKDCIRGGTVQRMELAATISHRAKCSRRAALDLLDAYAGEDPLRHHWTFDVMARGAMVYRLLEPPKKTAEPSATPNAPEADHE